MQQSMGQSANTCSHSCVVLFQVGQCANNRVRHNRGSGTARPSGLRRQSLCPWLNPTYSQPPIQPPAVPQHFCTAQKALARSFNYQISRRSATDHRNKCSSCPSTHPTKAPQLPHITSFNSGWIQHLPWEMAVALPPSHRPYIFLRKRKPHQRT